MHYKVTNNPRLVIRNIHLSHPVELSIQFQTVGYNTYRSNFVKLLKCTALRTIEVYTNRAFHKKNQSLLVILVLRCEEKGCYFYFLLQFL